MGLIESALDVYAKPTSMKELPYHFYDLKNQISFERDKVFDWEEEGIMNNEKIPADKVKKEKFKKTKGGKNIKKINQLS